MDAGIVGVLGTVLGVLLAGPITYYFSRELVNKTHNNAISLIELQNFNKAAATFRTEFINEIFMLRKNIISGDESVSRIITDETFIRHEKAKIIFEPFLPDLGGFNEAWEKYKNCEYCFFSQAPTYNPGNITNRKEFSQFYLNHIDDLLKFAEPKLS